MNSEDAELLVNLANTANANGGASGSSGSSESATPVAYEKNTKSQETSYNPQESNSEYEKVTKVSGTEYNHSTKS